VPHRRGKGGDYFFTVKDNQPELKAAVADAFAPPESPAERRQRAESVRRAASVDKGHGHGRIEFRRLEATDALTGWLDWPGVAQVCRLRRTRTVRGSKSVQELHAVTSLPPGRAPARWLLDIARAHWGIENRLYRVRDEPFGEDACRMRSGAAPQVLAAVRNAALRLTRAAGVLNIAAALRRHAAVPAEAVALLRRPPPNDF
jgi:hypothetical protein